MKKYIKECIVLAKLLDYDGTSIYTKMRRMKKRLLSSVFVATAVFTLASCSTNVTTTSTVSEESTLPIATETKVESTTITTTEEVTTSKTALFTIKVTDIDGEVTEKSFDLSKYTKLSDALKEMNAVSTDYGTYISLDSLANSIVDSNWYLAFYENNEYSSVGAFDESIHLDDGDVFTFTATCWNTIESEYGSFDSYDVLVDEAIYYYAKHKLQDTIKATTTYKNSTYWEHMATYMMKNNGYDSKIFNLNNATAEFKDSLKSIVGLDGAEFGKYYYAARLVDSSLIPAFKKVYKEYLPTLTKYDEYKTPFITSIAKELECDNLIPTTIKNTEYRAATGWGTDGLAWELTNLALYNTLEKSELSALNATNLESSYSKDTSLALYCLPYAAMNLNVREINITEDKDVIEYLFDTYYDKTTHQFNTEKLGTGDYSSNQIYASLMAYKVNRDTKKAVNLFA